MISLFTKHLSRGPADNFWYAPASRSTTSGQDVTEESSMTYSAAWAATRLLCSSGACLPFNLMRKTGYRQKEVADSSRVHGLIHNQPNPEMTSASWRAFGIDKQVNCGQAYAEIERDVLGRPLWLWPIHNSRVSIGRLDADTARRHGVPARSIGFMVRSDDHSVDIIPDKDMLHVKSHITRDGIVGKGVIENARETIGFGLATEKQGAAYFKNSARPLIVIKGGRFRNPEEREEYRRTWMELHGGAENNGKPAMLPQGSEIDRLSFSPEDSQFLQTRQHNIEELARWYGVPPHMIGHLLRSTNNNIEQQSLEFVVYSLIPWLKMWEEEIWRKLLTPTEQASHFAKHNVDGLLRGDQKTRSEFYRIMWELGVFSTNDIRDKEDLNEVEGGDKRFVPLNFQTLDQAGEQVDAEPEQVPDPPDIEDDDDGLSDEILSHLKEHHGEHVELQAKLEKVQWSIGQLQPAADPLDRVRALAEEHLRDTIDRMIQKEIRAASTAAEKPAKEFFGWINEFYSDRAGRLSGVIVQPLRVYMALDDRERFADQAAQVVAEHLVLESRESLLAATEVQPEQLTSSVAACLAEWGNRAKAFNLEDVSNVDHVA